MTSSGSSGNSNSEDRVHFVGVPKRCSCGERIVALTSKSGLNPNRRYLHCVVAVGNTLAKGHIFKWVDEALLEEFEKLSDRVGRLEEAFSIGMERGEEMLMEAKLEAKIEVQKALKIVLVVVVICFILMFVVIRLIN